MDCDFVCSEPEMGKSSGPAIAPASTRNNATLSGCLDYLHGFLHDHGVRLVNPVDEFGQLLQNRSEFIEPRMNGRGRLEFHFRRGVSRSTAIWRFSDSPRESRKVLHPHTSARYSSSVQPRKQGARHIFISE